MKRVCVHRAQLGPTLVDLEKVRRHWCLACPMHQCWIDLAQYLFDIIKHIKLDLVLDGIIDGHPKVVVDCSRCYRDM